MTTLHDRLADLADDAPPGGAAPDLWDRGRRYQRLRRAGTAVIVATAVVLLAVVAGLDWQRAAPAPAPAPAGGPAGLPDRVWSPSPWLPSTTRPGQLIAVSGAEKGTWTGGRSALVVISASTGDYAFLDLPGADLENGDVELAPDGRHLAYWLTGPTADTPNSYSGPLTGLAVYDTETGETTRHWISTAHGLEPDFLAWADSDTVVFSAGQIRGGDDDPVMDQSSSTFGTATAWPLGGEPRPVAGVGVGASLEGAAHGRILVSPLRSRPGREHLLVDVADPSRARFIDVPQSSGARGSLHFVAVGRTGSRVALVPGNRNPSVVKAGPAEELREVPGSQETFGVVDWLDADTIVTLRRTGRRLTGESGLYRVSVSTGRSTELVRLPADTYGGDWQFATDLLDAPTVHAARPPSPLDRRGTAGLGAGVCLAAAAALVLWRRRVRP